MPMEKRRPIEDDEDIDVARISEVGDDAAVAFEEQRSCAFFSGRGPPAVHEDHFDRKSCRDVANTGDETIDGVVGGAIRFVRNDEGNTRGCCAFHRLSRGGNTSELECWCEVKTDKGKVGVGGVVVASVGQHDERDVWVRLCSPVDTAVEAKTAFVVGQDRMAATLGVVNDELRLVGDTEEDVWFVEGLDLDVGVGGLQLGLGLEAADVEGERETQVVNAAEVEVAQTEGCTGRAHKLGGGGGGEKEGRRDQHQQHCQHSWCQHSSFGGRREAI